MKALDWLERRTKGVRLILGFLTITAIGLIDYATGAEVAFSIFYLLPVAMIVWTGGLAAGYTTAVICGGVWLLADLAAGHQYSHPWIPYWNMTTRIGFFLIVGHILGRLRLLLIREQAFSRVDALTGLWNSRYFLELAEREVERCRRSSRPVTIAYLDLDDFKAVNDTLGHLEGDALLREVGQGIRSGVRQNDVAARMGGDEFILMLPETGPGEALKVLRRVRESLQNRTASARCPVGFSIGAVTHETPPDSLEDMIRVADDLMYRVKKEGKGALRLETGRGGALVEEAPRT